MKSDTKVGFRMSSDCAIAIIDAFLVTKNHYGWVSRPRRQHPGRLHCLGFPHYQMVYLICFYIEHHPIYNCSENCRFGLFRLGELSEGYQFH